MELKTFIKESLKALIAGIEDIQDYASAHGATINPLGQSPVHTDQIRGNMFWDKSSERYGQYIEFDISITASIDKDKNEGISVGIGNASAGIGLFLKKRKRMTDASQNRMKFVIPMILPSSGSSEDQKKLKEILEKERK